MSARFLRGPALCSLLAIGAGCGGSDDASGSGGRGGSSELPRLPVARTTEGPVVGVYQPEQSVWAFKGIPFAAPPLGDLRWKSPQPPPVHTDALDSVEYGFACLQAPQVGALGALGGLPPTDEDCLTLNVWLPDVKPDKPWPVMVWFHGGGFIGGAGSQGLYDGARLAQQGVVVVTVNYRLGALGFMAHRAAIGEEGRQSAGNYGILDQIAALEWVHDNIAFFGGDPARVTIAGESAGGVSVCTLMASPLTDGLFQAAINQSGPCLNDIAIHDLTESTSGGAPAVDQGDRLATALGCDTASEALACMRGKPGVDAMTALQNAVFLSAAGAESWLPVVDGHVLEESIARTIRSGKAKQVPMIIGFTADEGTLLATLLGAVPSEEVNRTLMTRLLGETRASQILDHYSLSERFAGDATKQLSTLIADGVMVCPGRRAARDHANAGNPVFAYAFTHVTAIGAGLGWGAFHGSDVPFVWGNPPTFAGTTIQPTPDEWALIDAIQAYWTGFMTGGVPTSAGSPEWPKYDPASESYMNLDVGLAVEPAWPNAEDCAFWESVLGDDL